MRSYHHYCGVAKALDVVGDRWTLLVVRELLLRGPSRYTDLQKGLPGIATNLLVTRLRELEESGLVVRQDAPPPVATTLFALTERGAALELVIAALGAWAGPLMSELGDDDEVCSRWLTLPVRIYLVDRNPGRKPVSIEVRTGDEPMVIETTPNGVQARPGTAIDPDVVLSGPPNLVMGLLMGRLTVGAARARGLSVQGDMAALSRVGPKPP